MPAKPPAAQTRTPGQSPVVERGDELYFRARGKPFTGKVLAHGEHGCTLLVKGQRHKVRWDSVLGVKTRVQPALSIVEEGEDGFIAKEQTSGKLRYVHDPIGVGEDDMGEDELVKSFRPPSAIERIAALRREEELAKALKNAPGLTLQRVTDKSGHQTQRWKRNAPKEKAQPRHGARDDAPAPKGSAAGYGTHNLGVGDHVAFEAGAFKGDGEIVAAGRKGANVKDSSGRLHKVDWSEMRGHKKPTEGTAGGGKGGGKEPPKASTGDDGEKPKKAPAKKWTDPDQFVATNYAKDHNDPDVTPADILAKFPADTAEKIATAVERLKHIEDTVEANKRGGNYTAERSALHDKIIFSGIRAKVVNETTGEWEEQDFPGLLSEESIRAATPADGEEPTFTLLGGRGGSGKSWFSKSGMIDKDKAIFLDSDHIKSLLPEYEGWNAAQVHEEASEIFDRVTQMAKTMNLNIVHDATMKTASKAINLVQAFKDDGYRVEAHYMHLPRQEAAKRAVERFLSKTQRLVPPDIVLGMTTNEDSFDKVRPHVDAWSFRDNNVPRHTAPILISESQGARRPPGEGNS